MNKIYRLLSLPMFLLAVPVEAREIGTPLTPLAVPPLRGYIHYPVTENEDDDVCDWDIDVFGGAYARHADRAFDCENGTETTSLASLIFGRDEFTISQAFANSTAIVPRNPWVNISLIRPELEYDEQGAVFGISAGRLSPCDCYHYGFRAKLPVRYITLRDNRCDCEGLTVDNVCLLNQEVYPEGSNDPSDAVKDVFAYRLDFLASLRNAQGENLLTFSDPSQSNRVTFGTDQSSIDLTTGNLSNDGFEISGAKVHLLGGRANGSRPSPNFGLEQPKVNQLAALPADGSGLIFPNRAVFGANVNYGGLAPNASGGFIQACDENNLADLWLVPSIACSSAIPPDCERTSDAAQINSTVQEVIRYLDANILGFLEIINLDFSTQHQEGVGDLNTELYLGYELDECSYIEGQFGVKFPTGKKVRDTNKPFLLPLGNNGHFELRVGALWDWKVSDCFMIHLDSNYSWALKHCEALAAPFQGACVKNVGPCIEGEVSWNYYIGHLNLTFIPPCNEYVGFAMGYEPYVKQRDSVRFSEERARDFQGNFQTLDPSVLEARTKVISHRVITEFFYVEDCFNFYAGWTHVFAGQNVPKDTDFYVGFQVDF